MPTLPDNDYVTVMPLCDIPLEPSYKNPVYFDTKGKMNDGTYKSPTREVFFAGYDSNYSASGSGYQEVNFVLGDTIRTSIELEVTDLYKLNANYMHVIYSKITPSATTKTIPNHLFYFVTSVTHVQTNVYRYNLELDVITTFSPYLEVRGNNPLFTERKHCNRWGVPLVGLDKTFLPFRTGSDADVLLGDEIDGRFKAERYLGQSAITPFYTEFPIVHNNAKLPSELPLLLNSSALDIRKVKTWMYVFILRSEEHPDYSTRIYKDGKQYIDLPYATFVAPLDYADDNPLHSVLCYIGGEHFLNQPSAKKLYETFIDDINLVGIRVSNINPYTYISESSSTYVTNYTYVELQQEWSGIFPDGYGVLKVDGTFGDDSPALYSGEIFWQVLSLSYNAVKGLPTTGKFVNELPLFNITDFALGTNKNNVYEPKLFTSPFMRFGLKLQGSDIKDYDMIMGSDNGYNDILITKQGLVLPDSQKSLYTLDGGAYKDLFKSNVGLTFNPAYSLPMINDIYKNFLATQSQQQLQSVVMGTIGGVAEMGVGIATLGVASTGAGVVKGTSGLAGGVFSGVSSLWNYFAKRQDMKNAPDSISKMGQNTLTDLSSGNDEEAYLIKYGLVEKEEEMVADYFYENGYKVNRECLFAWNTSFNPDDYMITRTLFNYLKINDEALTSLLFAKETSGSVTINYTLSPAQRKVIAGLFDRGVQLWTLYGITTFNDIQKYYLAKQYENIELSAIIDYQQYLTFSMTFSGCTVGVDDAYMNIGFDIDELTFAWDDIMLTGETGVMTADELTSFIYETITDTDPAGSWYETNMSLLSQFDVFIKDGKIIFRSKTDGIKTHTFYPLTAIDFSVSPTLTFNILQEGK